ncbi:MAG: cyclic nucleotide-binding domain-containing protein [Spirochaetes bacterium]|nr:cyclic nucleotide-binding domain-containing protein [Spirochaetota bacterium]
MSQTTYRQLYLLGSKPNAVYLLNEGTVYFYVTETDKYALKGSGLIVGTTEIILSRAAGIETNRIESAVLDSDADVKKIDVEKYMNNIFSYSYILNSCMVMAKQVALTNEIIRKNSELLSGHTKKLKEISVEYYQIITALQREYHKRRLPYLKELITKYQPSLTYKRGEALQKTIEPERTAPVESLKSRMREIPPGTILCKEGTIGDEMYILNSGTLEVLVGDNRVTTISEPGTIIGEMALLLGEKRAATLRALNTAIVTPINKQDLKEIAEKENKLFLSIAISLARRHDFNVKKIHSINEMLITREIDEVKGSEYQIMELHKAKSELSSLKSDIEKLINTKKADFLNELV